MPVNPRKLNPEEIERLDQLEKAANRKLPRKPIDRKLSDTGLVVFGVISFYTRRTDYPVFDRYGGVRLEWRTDPIEKTRRIVDYIKAISSFLF